MKHMPAPWRSERWNEKAPNIAYIFDDNNSEVAVIYCAGSSSGVEHLIAAAPELLEALTMVRDADNDCIREGALSIPPMARSKIDAAIAKAEGNG